MGRSMKTDPDAYKRTVKRYPKAVSAGEFDVIEEICTESIVNHTPLADVTGHEALKPYETRIHEAFPGFDVAFDDLLVEGDRVAMRLTITGDHQGPMMDIEPTGTEVTFGNTIFHRMEGGLIAKRWVQPDIFGILVQLGAIDRPS
jgi:predicted ester cyclase